MNVIQILILISTVYILWVVLSAIFKVFQFVLKNSFSISLKILSVAVFSAALTDSALSWSFLEAFSIAAPIAMLLSAASDTI